MLQTILLPVALLLAGGLLVAEKRKSTALILAFKTPLSALFVLTALIQPHPLTSYYHYILAGLVWGLIGDVCLALPGSRTFRAGLVAFLIGHILYVVAFASLTQAAAWLSPVLGLIVVVSVAVFWWLRPNLGAMVVPVGLYVIVITVMVAAAWVAFLTPTLNPTGAWALFIGAVFFYLSDVFVAREKFVESQFLNRLVGLSLYYSGQFLIAFSVGWIV